MYSCSGTILNPYIICIRIRPNICARILFVFVFAHSEKKRILFVFVFGQNSDSEYYSYSYSVQKTVFAHLWLRKVEKFITKFCDYISDSLHSSWDFSLKSSPNWVIHPLGWQNRHWISHKFHHKTCHECRWQIIH